MNSVRDGFDAVSRRLFFGHMATGMCGVALTHLLGRTTRLPAATADELGQTAAQRLPDLKPKISHFAPRAKAVIQLFMHGGPSQVDLFDPKPLIRRYAGKKFQGDINVLSAEQAGGLLPTPFRFSHHGEAGIPVSEIMPHIAECVDDLTLIRSMHTGHINHEPALWMAHTGATIPGRPSLPSWVIYGLGSENENLPAFVVLDDERGLPINGIQNWSAGWLPPIYQGTRFRSQGEPVWNLRPHRALSDEAIQRRRNLLRRLDRVHRQERPGEPELDARISSYELAARMQLAATDALDLAQESQRTRSLYGLDKKVTESYGRRCLMARRLIERGVRYVQLYVDGQIWDNHGNLKKGLTENAARTDKPVAALVKDLKARGLLDDTLVIWGGEFGRLPISQQKNGRDHNNDGFTIWMAGGGVKRGYIHGATDDFGYKAVEDRVSMHEFHATTLHLLGLDHESLSYPRHGLSERLTGVEHPRVVKQLLA